MEIDKQIYYLEARLHQCEGGEILIMIRNMTERILMERRLRELIERDNLTKLFNRRNFEEVMNRYNGKEVENITYDPKLVGIFCGIQKKL